MGRRSRRKRALLQLAPWKLFFALIFQVQIAIALGLLWLACLHDPAPGKYKLPNGSRLFVFCSPFSVLWEPVLIVSIPVAILSSYRLTMARYGRAFLRRHAELLGVRALASWRERHIGEFLLASLLASFWLWMVMNLVLWTPAHEFRSLLVAGNHVECRTLYFTRSFQREEVAAIGIREFRGRSGAVSPQLAITTKSGLSLGTPMRWLQLASVELNAYSKLLNDAKLSVAAP